MKTQILTFVTFCRNSLLNLFHYALQMFYQLSFSWIIRMCQSLWRICQWHHQLKSTHPHQQTPLPHISCVFASSSLALVVNMNESDSLTHTACTCVGISDFDRWMRRDCLSFMRLRFVACTLISRDALLSNSPSPLSVTSSPPLLSLAHRVPTSCLHSSEYPTEYAPNPPPPHSPSYPV